MYGATRFVTSMTHDRTPRPLRVGIISTSALSTPPTAYGGTELFIAELARELHELGHSPVVFATGDSTCVGARSGPFARAVWPPDPIAELRHIGAAWAEIAEDGLFDVVHVNHAYALPFTAVVPVPTVATIHHDRSEALVAHYASYPDVAFVAISARQAELSHEIPFRSVIHHGLDTSRYPAGAGEGGFCAFLGRFAVDKGPHLAIDAARAAGVPIRLGGEAHPPEREYFLREVAPRLGPGAEWLGELDHPRKVALLRAARCLLVPIQWEEPFGLVMIEAMLVGTPVIAFSCGAAPEIIDEGVSGFLVSSVEEMRARIADVVGVDRRRCRARARERWGAARMASQYASLYGDVAATWHAPARPAASSRGGGRARTVGIQTR